jgi:hypothetical protein
MNDSGRLDSWKEIAAYLGRDVTTLIRWEKERGLPVHRVQGGKLPRVFAFTNELDEWLRGDTPAVAEAPRVSEQPKHVRFLSPAWMTGLGLAILAVAISIVFAPALRGRAVVPHSVALISNALVARDIAGSELWSHSLGASAEPSASRWLVLRDAVGDTSDEVLAAVQLKGPAGNVLSDRLHLLSAQGELRWTYEAPDRIRFREAEFAGPWSSHFVETYRAGTEPRIAWAVHHFTWWPGLLISLTPNGERVGTFVNGGWIGHAAGSRDGRHLYIAGVSNAHRSYFFAILDAANPSGSSPEPEGSLTECLSCPAGKPLAYYVFPRTDVSSHFAFPGVLPTITTFDDGRVQVDVMHTPEPAIGTTVFEFDPAGKLQRARPSDALAEWHRRLEQEGRLTHRAAACPDITSVKVRYWTPATGWEQIE